MVGWSVLNVDDNIPGRYARTKLLERHGFKVSEASTGTDALRIAAESQPDAILLDVNLPDIDGLTVCWKLKTAHQTAHIPVIQISASMTDPHHQADALEHGSEAFLAEPVHPTILVSTLRAAIRAAKAEEELRKRASTLDALMEYLPEGIAIAEAPEVRLAMVSRRGAELHGVTRADLEGRGATDRIGWALFHSDGETPAGPDQFPLVRATLLGEVVTNEEWVLRREDGESVPCLCEAGPIRDPDGTVTGGIIAFRDIRPWKSMQEELRASHARIEKILAGIAEGYIELDVEGRVNAINAAAAEALGRGSESLLGKLFFKELNQKTCGEFEECFRRALETEAPVQREMEVTSGRWHEVYAHFERDSVSFYLREVTERKRNEEQLRDAQKLESLGMLAGGIAHDFNNLLSGIMGNASLALGELPEDHVVRTMLQDVIKSSQRAADLTAQLLAYAGKGRFYLEAIDVTGPIRKVAGRVSALIGKDTELLINCPDSLPKVTADPHQIEQVLISLLMNALEAIGEARGLITISSRVETIGDEFARSELGGEVLPGRYVSVEIRDTGPGISPDILPRIFDPFFSTKFMGRGLGLAAARGIVSGHHGSIWVRSSPGLGSTFRVYLPIPEKHEARPHAVQFVRPLLTCRTVLVVDDEELVLNVCRSTLEPHGFEVLSAHGGIEAVELLKERISEISIAVLDVTMPQLSGEETLPLLLDLRPDLAVIVSSGYTRAQVMAKFGEQPNVVGFLQKPYSPSVLLQMLQPLFDQSTGQ